MLYEKKKLEKVEKKFHYWTYVGCLEPTAIQSTVTILIYVILITGEQKLWMQIYTIFYFIFSIVID